MTVLGVVLAAGDGRRFVDSGGSGPKQRAELMGIPLVLRATRVALGARLAGVVVVQGAAPLADLLPPNVVVVTNPDWADGIATSLQVAIQCAHEGGHDAVVVGLADQPAVSSAAWAAVAAAPVHPPIAVATYGGRRANPVRLARAVWPLLPTAGDDGARAVMRARPDLVQEVPTVGDPTDVDVVADLDRLR